MITLGDILNYYHITPQFPPAAAIAAQNMPTEVSERDLKGRLDLTDSLIFTIDGDDAKDFDDAVSLETLENGNFLLGVHIADVSHYVTEKSPIDTAAYTRGTSVYLIDTVIPMLPFELSNGLCSLNPNVVRLTLSVFMEITPKGKIVDYKIYESYIQSKYRMTYKNVNSIFEGDKELREKYSEIVPVLLKMLKLSKILNKKRIMRGAIEFVTSEAKIELSKDGIPVSVERYPILSSNSVIEEFMLAANETVAKHFETNKLPCVFRVHEEPSYEKVERLRSVLPILGVKFPLADGKAPADYQKILDEVKGLENESIINYILLRSMSKAKYSESNLGHFGLAAEYYCHFTSPIRRYPDLITHRILKDSIHKRINSDNLPYYLNMTVCAAISSTSAEINAQDAENDWEKIKKIEFMEDKTGEIFTGNISHVTANGFFVELENTVEGFVPARTLEDDTYIISDNKLSLEGIMTKNKYTVGDRVKIKVDFADSESLTLDFLIHKKVSKKKTKAATKSKVAKKALKALKKEGREIREERELRRFKIDYEADRLWKKAQEKILSPLISVLGVKNSERRFVRTSFEDFWHLSITAIIREISQKNTFDGLEKYISSVIYSFENFIITVETSLEKAVDKTLKNKYNTDMEKMLKEFINNLKKQLGDINEQ